MAAEQCAAAFEQVPIAISVTDADGTVLTVNSAFLSLFGRVGKPPVGEHISALVPSADAALTNEIRRRVIEGEIDVFRSTQRYLTADGDSQRLNVVLAPLVGGDGRRVALVTTYDYALADRPVEDDSYLQRVLAASQSSLLTLDGDGVVHSTGGRYGDALGYPPEFWHGRPFRDVVADPDRDRFDRYFAELSDRPSSPIDVELEVIAADGSSRAILASATNLLTDPAVTAVVMSFQDVSELHHQITELVEERQVAEGIARDRADLIATVSHELRNPLHALQGLAEILATSELPGDLSEIATELHSQLSGLASVTSDLLETARADRGSIELHPVPTEVNDILQQGVQYGRAAVGTKPVEVRGFLESNTPAAVMIDRPRVDQIIRNLVGNAAKFTDSGSINLTIGPIAHGLHLTVADSGGGIPAADLEQILQPFARGSNSGGSAGAGLGLAIVNDLARAMGGQVLVDSRLGRGSRFRVEIVAPKSLSAPPEVPNALELERFDLQALVVDDDRTNRVIASRQLERFGCTVTTAHSGEEALEMLQQPVEVFPVDLVLMDRRMPGIDGAATTLAIRRIPHRADVFVIGLTASASEEERAECSAATMDAFVAKPASLFDLHAVVAAHIHSTSSTPTTETASRNDDTTDGVGDGPFLDRERIRELIAEFDDARLVLQLLEMFAGDLPAQVAEAQTAARVGELTAVGRIAHTIKGSAALLGADALESAARVLESAPDGDLGAFARIAAATIADVEAVCGSSDFFSGDVRGAP